MSERGQIFDLARYIDRLMRSPDPYAYVIINVANTEDFMQLTGDASGVQIDFPQVTPRQRSFEEKIREVASREGLDVIENHGSTGELFLDLNVNGEWRAVAAICSKVLRDVYNLSGETELTFNHDGLATEEP